MKLLGDYFGVEFVVLERSSIYGMLRTFDSSVWEPRARHRYLLVTLSEHGEMANHYDLLKPYRETMHSIKVLGDLLVQRNALIRAIQASEVSTDPDFTTDVPPVPALEEVQETDEEVRSDDLFCAVDEGMEWDSTDGLVCKSEGEAVLEEEEGEDREE
jgi:hypothetical protein